MNRFDRNQLGALVAIGEHGSLTQAARALGLSQPTLGRLVSKLEQHVGFPIVVRHARGVRLTERAQTLLPLAKNVEAGVERFLRQANALATSPTGCVRVSASEILAIEVLPRWVATLRDVHPHIQIAVVAANDVADLARGDADIALRMFRPKGDQLVAQKLGVTPLALYASRGFLERHAHLTPETMAQEAPVVFFDKAAYFQDAAEKMVGDITEEQRVFRSDSLTAQLAGVRAGLGVGGLQCLVANEYRELVQVGPVIGRLEVWLTTHVDLRLSDRVRVVFESLRDFLMPQLAALKEEPPISRD